MSVKKEKKKKDNSKILVVITCLLMVCLISLATIRIGIGMKSTEIEPRVEKLKEYAEKQKDLDVQAWIKVPGTNIDYPVLRETSELSDEKEQSINYVWENGDLTKLNKINYIMGHNILNLSANPLITNKDHSRFEQLMSFTYLEFAEKNEYVQLTTGGKDYLFKIFAVYYPISDELISYNKENADKNYVKDYMDIALEKSIYNYDVDVNEDDTFISLITCTRMFGSRRSRAFVVSARLVRDGESTRNYKVTKSKNYDEVEKQMKGDNNSDEEA